MAEHPAHSLAAARRVVDEVNNFICDKLREEGIDPLTSSGEFHEAIADFWCVDFEDAKDQAQDAANQGIGILKMLSMERDVEETLPATMATVFFMGLYTGRVHAIPGLIEGIDPEGDLPDLPDDVQVPDVLPEETPQKEDDDG